MATEYLFSNNATTTLAQSVSATATVLNVASGDGSLFPSPTSGQAFAVTLVDAATGLTNEICYCTSRSGDQLTVIRGREGTNAIAWAAGDTCANYITADVMESWLQESDLDGYATDAWVDGRYVRGIWNTTTDQRILSIARNKTDSGIYVQLDDNTSQRLQIYGDYATNAALASEVTNRQNADNNLVAKNYSQGPSVNSIGIVSASGQPFCVDSTGKLRYIVKSPGSTATDVPIQSVGINNQRIYVSYNNDTQAAWLVRSPAEGSGDTRVGSIGIAGGVPYFGYGGNNDATYPLYLATQAFASGTFSIGTSGYQIFPSGLMLQWDTVTIIASTDPANNSTTVNFPTSFPRGCFGIVGVDFGGDCNPIGANPLNNGQSQLRSFKRNTNASASNTTIVHYLAWGY